MDATRIPADRPSRCRWGGLLAACMASLAAGCTVNPVSGRPEVAVLSVDKERELGDEQAREVEASMGLAAAPELGAYVRAVGSTVARHSPRQDTSYAFQIVNRPEPNAFALPNGHIYVSRGLLALANTEDELAGVLAHEIIHVAARHTVRSANVAVATSPLRIATGIAGAAAGILAPRVGEGIMGLGETVTEALLAPYGRDQEREADDVGIELAARSGYDPAGLTRMLQTLEREEALRREGPPRRGFFDTHPATPERVRETRGRAAALRPGPAAPVARTPRELLARLDGLLVGDDPADGTFVESLFLHPVLGVGLRFPAEWRTRNTPREALGHTKDKEAAMLFTAAGKSDDPAQVAREAERVAGMRVMATATALQINGLRALRSVVAAEGAGGPTTLDFTWIAHGGMVYRIVGVSPTPRYAAYRPVFDRGVASFRPVTPADKAQIREARLRLVTARAGERPGDLARRTGSIWSGDQIAVVNALATDVRLVAGQVLKVALLEPYRDRQ